MEEPSILETLLAVDVYRLLHLAAVFCLAFLLLKAIQLHHRRKELLKALQCFPGPPCHWLYGQVHEFVEDGYDLDKLVAWGIQYPYAYPVWFGRFVAYLNITHPDYAKTLMARGDPKDNVIYSSLIPWIGKGLLVLSGQKWFQHRRLLTPGFHYDVLKPYVKLIADSTKVMLYKWESLVNEQQSVDVYSHVSLMTLDSIMKCAFSYESNCQTDSDNAYTQAVFNLSALANIKLKCFLYHNDFLFYLSPAGYRFRRACEIAHQHTGKVIKQRKESLKEGVADPEKERSKRHLDFLDILLCARDENGEGLSDEDLRAEVDTFMFEGHDTTASAISWILYSMAMNQEHQEKCREEIIRILGDREMVEWDDLSKMTYTTTCIKESLRLYPPVPMIARQLSKPITFFDGRTYPEGCLASVSIYALHRNPTVWKDPEVPVTSV
ncbi:cytochrome P450 4B1-like isoform X2 [Ambystoma mexicanum]|uniref:cytochrome P450 4B1-like isoform X2 n=1 Tax=Ambystoma mexicanum TaxID=8296 RepID=UPI0037E8BDE5